MYHETLATHKNAWEQEQRTVDWYETKRELPLLNETRPSLKLVHYQVLQNVTGRVELAFNAFFRCVKAGDVEENWRWKKALTHIHERIANRRLNFAHQRSRELVNHYQVITFEDLVLREMGQSRGDAHKHLGRGVDPVYQHDRCQSGGSWSTADSREPPQHDQAVFVLRREDVARADPRLPPLRTAAGTRSPCDSHHAASRSSNPSLVIVRVWGGTRRSPSSRA